MAKVSHVGYKSLPLASAVIGLALVAGCAKQEPEVTPQQMREAEETLQIVMIEKTLDDLPYETRTQICEDFRRDSSYALAQFMKSAEKSDFDWDWNAAREAFEKKCY